MASGIFGDRGSNTVTNPSFFYGIPWLCLYGYSKEFNLAQINLALGLGFWKIIPKSLG